MKPVMMRTYGEQCPPCDQNCNQGRLCPWGQLERSADYPRWTKRELAVVGVVLLLCGIGLGVLLAWPEDRPAVKGHVLRLVA